MRLLILPRWSSLFYEVVLLALLFTFLFVPYAFAQDANADGVAAVICSPEARPYLVWLIGTVLAFRLATTFRTRLAKAPPAVQIAVHFLAANWRTAAETAIQAAGYTKAAVVLMAAVVLSGGLAGCSALGFSAPTGNLQTDLNTWATQTQAFNTNFLAKASAFNTKVVATIVPAGKAACALASEVDGLFNSALGQVAVEAGVTAAGGTAANVAAVQASEKSTFNDVQNNCNVVNGMDPTNPTQAEITAVQLLLQDAPQLLADLNKVSPTAAALVQALPAPATAAPAAPAPASH